MAFRMTLHEPCHLPRSSIGMPQFISTRRGNCTGTRAAAACSHSSSTKAHTGGDRYGIGGTAERRALGVVRDGVTMASRYGSAPAVPATANAAEPFGKAVAGASSALPSGQFTNRPRVEVTTAQSMPALSENPPRSGVDSGIGQYGHCRYRRAIDDQRNPPAGRYCRPDQPQGFRSSRVSRIFVNCIQGSSSGVSVPKMIFSGPRCHRRFRKLVSMVELAVSR